jgi:hypothetical protein
MTPGACHSQINRGLTGWKKIGMSIVKMLIARSPEEGSRTLIAGIVAQQDSHGQYMADCKIARCVSILSGTTVELIQNRPADFMGSEEGAVLQSQLWVQTMEILNVIEPSIARSLS